MSPYILLSRDLGEAQTWCGLWCLALYHRLPHPSLCCSSIL